jgi:hypothetical protein
VEVKDIQQIIDTYLRTKPLGETFNSGVLAYRIFDGINQELYRNQQYLHLGKWAATREEIAVGAAAGEDIESIANRLKLSTELEHWSVHAVANNYWHFLNRVAVRKDAYGRLLK